VIDSEVIPHIDGHGDPPKVIQSTINNVSL
jgi:hypothetical protein